MSTKRQKRITKQVRLSQTVLMRLKYLAVTKGLTYSALLDEIVMGYLEVNPEAAQTLKVSKE